MSLINDALKKAQKQRTGEAPDLAKLPSVGGEAPTRIAKREKPPAFNSLVLWVSGGAATALVIAVGGFFLIRWMMRPPAAESAVAPSAQQKIITQVATVTKGTPTAVQPGALATTASTPALVTVKSAIPEVAVETKSVEVAPTAPPPPPVAQIKPAGPPSAPQMGPKATAFIDALRVAGVRASGADSKVLMNDRVYRIGDTVEHVLGLKITGITTDALTFEDDNGARYTRKL